MYCIFLFPSDPELWSASNVDSWVGYLVVNVFNYQTRFPHSFNVDGYMLCHSTDRALTGNQILDRTIFAELQCWVDLYKMENNARSIELQQQQLQQQPLHLSPTLPADYICPVIPTPVTQVSNPAQSYPCVHPAQISPTSHISDSSEEDDFPGTSSHIPGNIMP